MHVSNLSRTWQDWVGPLQVAFPGTPIPDIYPRAALWEALVQRIADAHDLTPAEVNEMIEELVLHDIAQAASSQAA